MSITNLSRLNEAEDAAFQEAVETATELLKSIVGAQLHPLAVWSPAIPGRFIGEWQGGVVPICCRKRGLACVLCLCGAAGS